MLEGALRDYTGAYTLGAEDAVTIGGISVGDSASCEATLQQFQESYVAMLPVVDGLAIEDGNLVLKVGLLVTKIVFEPTP
ncbi:MAG: hypothetical protein ACC726_04800 [Chloroflexota bacterium]